MTAERTIRAGRGGAGRAGGAADRARRDAAPAPGARRLRARHAARAPPPALKRYGQNHLVDRRHPAGHRRAWPPCRPTTSCSRSAPPTAAHAAAAGARAASCTPSRSTAASPGARAARRRPPSLRVHLGDALRATSRTLDPAPTALVANLAYNIAIPLLMTSIAGSAEPDAAGRSWCRRSSPTASSRRRDQALRGGLGAHAARLPPASSPQRCRARCSRRAARRLGFVVFVPCASRPPPGRRGTARDAGRRGAASARRYAALVRRPPSASAARCSPTRSPGAAHAGRALTRDEVRRALEASTSRRRRGPRS